MCSLCMADVTEIINMNVSNECTQSLNEGNNNQTTVSVAAQTCLCSCMQEIYHHHQIIIIHVIGIRDE